MMSHQSPNPAASSRTAGRSRGVLCWLLFWLLICARHEVRAEGVEWTPAVLKVRSEHSLTNLTARFAYTNSSKNEVVVTAINASCHCTTPRVRSYPWPIPAGASGFLEVEVEVAGKWGELNKTLSIETRDLTNTLRLIVDVVEPDAREKNRLAAFADRQAVFKGDCVSCHLKPAEGKTGAELFKSICSICHEAEHRAQMVPDLAAKPRGGAAYWSAWLRIGKPGSFMPAFDKPHGGPLTEEQIASLVEFLSVKYPPTTAQRPAMPLD